METFKLDDTTIAHIAKLLQLAIISGTDIVDHLRMVRLSDDGGTLFLDDKYLENSDRNIEKMLAEIDIMSETTTEENTDGQTG